MDIIKAIKERRSIRKFKKDPVPDEIINEIFELMRFSPSWANTQVWEYIIVRNPEVKEALSLTLSPKNPSTNAVKEAPVVLVACAKKKVSGFYKGESITTLGDWLMFDVALSIATLNLAASAKGLGLVNIGAFDIPKATVLLGVPENIQVVEILPIGYPDESPPAPKRKEVKDFLHFEKFENKTKQ